MATTERAVRAADLLGFRLRSFQAKVGRAQALIETFLSRTSRPYLAFSGGKDSLATLALAARTTTSLTVNWTDEELVYDEVLTYVPSTIREFGWPLLVTMGVDQHADWFWSWRDAPFWHEPLPGAIATGVRHTHRWLHAQGYDGTLLGLRKQEARRRQVYLAVRGALHHEQTGWRCNPLANWTVDDVWALIAGWELPYNPVYDVLARIQVERDRARVGPLPLAESWHLRVGWPALYRRLVERYGRHWA